MTAIEYILMTAVAGLGLSLLVRVVYWAIEYVDDKID